MAIRSSEDSGIFRPRFNYSAPSSLGYFDNLFTPSFASPLRRSHPSNTTPSTMSYLQRSDPDAFYHRIMGITDNDVESDSEILKTSDCSNLYVSTISKEFQWIMNLFRSECYFPPCSSPNFLETLDTSRSAHNVKIIAKFVAHPDSYIPMWKICYKPSMKLAPGLFVQGPFGQGVILELSHDDENFLYYICHTFNNGPVFLMLRKSRVLGQPNWWKIFVVRCKNLLPGV